MPKSSQARVVAPPATRATLAARQIAALLGVPAPAKTRILAARDALGDCIAGLADLAAVHGLPWPSGTAIHLRATPYRNAIHIGPLTAADLGRLGGAAKSAAKAAAARANGRKGGRPRRAPRP